MAYWSFLIGLVLSLVLTPAVRALARRFGFVDRPDEARKIHREPTPLLGGTAIFLSILIGIMLVGGGLIGGFILPKHLAGILLGSLVLIVGGALDDKYRLRPIQQMAFPALAALIVIASGIGVSHVTNPLGGSLQLDYFAVPVVTLGGVTYRFVFPEDLFTFLWLMVLMYTTKILDGMDGLVAGFGVIGSVVLALLALTAAVGQPEMAGLAMLVAGACLGFLYYNFRPATIFLGEGGSTLIGFLLGALAMLSGQKIGLTLMVIAVPFMDVIWTIFRRSVLDKRSFAQADAGHIYHQLAGLLGSRDLAVAVLWAVGAIFGVIGLLLKDRQQAMALAVLMFVFIAVSLYARSRHRELKK